MAEIKDDKAADGARKVGGLIAGATNKLALKEARRHAPYPNAGKPLEGMQPGQWREAGFTDDTSYLPANCPIRPLGYEGENFYFEDTMGQVFNTGDGALGVERIQKLFAGHEDFLYWAYPGKNAKKMAYDPSFKAERVRRDLFSACRERGAWTMTDMVRGRGAWRGDEGRLILHCGDHLWIDNQMQDTGEQGAFFYVRRPPSLSPWPHPVQPADNPAATIMRLLETWNFERGPIDRMLVLGWIGIAMLGGALEWRPSIFVTGDAGTGKSELIGKYGLIRAILGRMMVSTTNASEAGLYQLVGHDSLAIAIDEMEGDEAPEQAQKIIKMARDAASGSTRIRGGQNHKGVEFQAQSSFLFSGINPPPIPPASMTRLAIIQLLPLVTVATNAPTLPAAETVGPRLLRILSDRWEDLRYVLNNYYAVLREAGHNARGQKTFGTFLALADVMLGDEGLRALGLPATTERYKWGEWLRPESLPELEGAQPAWRDCIDAILTSSIEAFSGGQRSTVAQVLEKLKNDDISTMQEVRDKLAAADIGIFGSARDGLILAVPNASRVIGKALMETPFGARNGNGSWRFALRRAPPEIVVKPERIQEGLTDNRVTVAGRQVRCTFIDLHAFRKWS